MDDDGERPACRGVGPEQALRVILAVLVAVGGAVVALLVILAAVLVVTTS